ncbi:LCP family protein [Streptomyces colonosanans]|uniref:LytR family transcriptional regulator n=1 Tax=Streptomyces colonosanans TaxID=1428652 RepID=A0A1S2P907_9ACTN|nr:LCP family protein [Streptomyces colonosanans]OIJ90160.1 LytR family transcriptional regulator [Streptomyces colonosanans]
MDAQGRGRADNVDPADQWVLNPNTGEYELRLPPSAPQSALPKPRRGARAGTAQGGTRTPSGSRRRAPEKPVPDTVPGPRRRRGAPEEPPPTRRRGRTKPKKGKAKKILLWTGGSMAFVLVAAAGAGYFYLKQLEGNVTTMDVGGAAKDSFSKDEAFNILIIGTDKRTGKGNEGYGDKGSVGHADTNILLHVSKDRTNATALSIPRDLIVDDIPDCPTKQPDDSTKVIPGSQRVRFNESLGQDGRDPGCTMRTVKELTGIAPDHFMMVDFNAVKTLTTAVGGVEVCVAKDIDDPKSHLKLSKGTHPIEGEQALAFLRTRHSFGNMGDLDRIKAQQQFLGSLARKMTSGDTLTDPVKLFDLANAATKALTVDRGIHAVSTLKDVALELNKVPPKNLTFVTVPVRDNPAEKVPVTVVVDQAQAPAVFDAIRNDVSFTEVKKKEKAQKDAAAARLKGSRSAASDIRVDIYNGGAKTGSAQTTLNWLQNQQGVLKSSQLGNAPENIDKTTLEYSPDQADQARKLADIMGLPGSALKPGESETNSQGLPAMKLTLGRDFKDAGIPLTAPKKAPDVNGKSTADKVTCAS